MEKFNFKFVNRSKYLDKNDAKVSKSAMAKEKLRSKRLLVLKYYSAEIPFCSCCGEKEIKFLSIDHISGGGTKHRKENGIGNIQSWLIKNNFPAGYQVLCHNCNMAKGFYGECPHKNI